MSPPLTLQLLASAAADEAGTADGVLQALAAIGMTQVAAIAKRAMFASAAKRLLDEGLDPSAVARAIWVPGRIEVAGKHTDYAGGRSLLCATTRGFAIVSVDRGDDLCRIFTTMGGSRERRSAELRISPDLMPEQGHWSAYPAIAIRRLARNFGIKKGASIGLECDLPEASGMSTSSAVICYMWMVLSERNDIRSQEKFLKNLGRAEVLYSYLGFIENGQDCGTELPGDKGVGTFGGSEDHTAIMSSEAGKLKLFSYCPTKHEGTIDFPSDAIFVIAVSGALAEKTGEAMADFNNAAFLARDAAAAWCEGAGEAPCGGKTFVPGRPNLAEVVSHVRAALGVEAFEPKHKRQRAGDTLASLSSDKVRTAVGDVISKLDDGATFGPDGKDGGSAGSLSRYAKGALRRRFEQFFDESEVLTPAIADALASADYETLGLLSTESHRQTVELLGNTIPETAWLPQEAMRLKALGASAFGAGFGGSCWAIVRKSDAEVFMRSWRKAYLEQFPRWTSACTFFIMEPGPGACVLR